MNRISHWIDGKVVEGPPGGRARLEPGHREQQAARSTSPRSAEVDAAVAAAKAAFPAWRATSPVAAGRGDVPHPRAGRRQPQGDRLAVSRPSTARCWPTRWARSPAAWRTSSSPAAIPNLLKGGYSEQACDRRRRVLDPPAARRRRRHHAVQLPGDGADVDVRQRPRLRQHVRPQAEREGSVGVAVHGRAAEAGRAARRRASTSCRATRSRSTASSSTRTSPR